MLSSSTSGEGARVWASRWKEVAAVMNRKRGLFVVLALVVASASAPARAQEVSGAKPEPAAPTPPATTEAETKKADPFAFADFTWLTGSPRTKESPLDTKAFTGEFRADTNFTYSFNKPIDDT